VALQVGIFMAIAVAAGVVAWWLRRRTPDGPPRDAFPVPRQLARPDFPRPEAPWLVAYFSSETCASCAGLGPKVAVLESAEVATCELDFTSQRELHERYDVSAVPMILIANCDGVVLRAFVGSTSATDLWAALAECREPGSTPEADLGAVH